MTIDVNAAVGWEARDLLGLVSALSTVVALGVTLVISKRSLQASRYSTDSAAWQKANEAELKAIEAQLDRFYGPLLQKSETNRLLARDLRTRQADADRFILLEKLFDRGWRTVLSEGERALLDELVSNARTIRAFLADRAPMSVTVIPYLSRADAHYRVFELAAEGKLGSDPKPWTDLYVYPRQVDGVLRLEVERLNQRADWLRRHPAELAPAPKPLTIPVDLELKPWVNAQREARPELTAPLSTKI